MESKFICYIYESFCIKQLKSDRFGMESTYILKKTISPHNPLKSDRFGMERILYQIILYIPYKLKSDRFGMESLQLFLIPFISPQC